MDPELRAADLHSNFEEEYMGLQLKKSTTQLQVQSPVHGGATSKSTQVHQASNKTIFHTDEQPIQDSQKKPKAGVSLMAFFFVRKFIQKLLNQRQKLTSLNENHYKLINDNASDIQMALYYTKVTKYRGIQLKNVSRLFRQATQQIQENKLSTKITDYFKAIKKSFLDKVNHVPQIHPESQKKIIWDYIATLARMMLLILIPIEIAFTPAIMFSQCLWLTVMLLLILIGDFGIRLNTITYLKGQAVLDKNQIATIVIKQSLFQDIIIIIPLLYFCITQEDSSGAQIILLTAFGQLKYIRQVIAKSEESSYFSKPQKGIFSLISLIFTLVFILHLFSCIWYYNSNFSTTGWIELKSLQDQVWQVQYLEAFYFAIVTMLTIGYGDNVPKTWNEKILAIIFILGACLWFSYSLNTIGNIINQITQNKVERSRKMRIINRYMNRRYIPYSLQYKIREYLTFRWKEEDEIDIEQEEQLLYELSDELREDLEKQAHSIFFEKCSLFSKNFSKEFQMALSPYIKRIIVKPQNQFSIYTISSTYEPHLCYIEQGQLQYQNDLKISLNTIQSQGQFIQVFDFIVENNQAQNYKAIGYVSLLTLRKQDFLMVLRKFPKEYEFYCKLKDDILFQNKQLSIENGIHCQACDQFDHSLNQCQKLQLHIDRELIVKRHLFEMKQERVSFQRQNRVNQHFQALGHKDLIEQFALYFQTAQMQAIQQQLKLQLVYEQEDDRQIVDDNGSPSPPFVINRRVSIQSITNSQYPHDKPPSPNSSFILQKESQTSLDPILPKQILGPPPDLQQISKFMLRPIPNAHKISLYKKSLYHKMNLNQESQDSSQNQDRNKTQDNNPIVITNIETLNERVYKLSKDSSCQSEYFQILVLYLRLKNMDEISIDGFDTIKKFDLYYENNNIQNVISSYNKKVLKQSLNVQRLLKYLYYPFEYINKYQKIKQLKIGLNSKQKSFKNITKRVLQMMDLKTVLVKRRITPRKSLKFSTISPSRYSPNR